MAGNKTDITTVFRADISQFSESITSLKRYISTVNSEFKVATKGSSDWAKSQDGLKAKITQLNRTLQAQEQIIAELEKEYDKVSKEQGENSAAAQKLTIEINKYRSSISKTKNDIDKYNKNLNEMGDEAKQGSKSLKDLDDATKKVSDGFTVAKGALAGFIANGLTALVGATKNAIGNVLGLADATREYRQTLATLDTAANDVGVSTDYIRDKFTDMMGVFNDEDSVTEGLNNLLTAGFDEKSLDSITSSLEGAALKWKDTLKFEGMADSLQEWIGSGGESLTGGFAELLERMGYNLEEVTEKTAGMTDEQRRSYATNLLAKEGLTEVSESYREQNSQMIEAQTANANYQNSLAAMGERIEPITTKIREGFTKILDKMLELLENVDMEAFALKIEQAFDKFVNDILPKIISALGWIIDNKDLIIAAVVAIGAAFVAWKVVGIVTSAVKAIKNMTAAMKALNAVMKANLIGIIITAIAALVAAFIYLWKNCESFRKFWKDLWEGIKKVAKAVWDAIVSIFKAAWNAIKSVWNGAKKFFSSIWNGIKSVFSAVGSFFKNIFSSAWNGIKNVWSGVTGFFSKIWEGIKNGAKGAINGVISVFEKGLNGIIKFINALTGGLSKLWSWAGIPAIPKISTISIPRLAKGGIVDKSTIAQIGEAGKEAVIPLERNTRGLDLIADKVSERISANGVTVNNYNTFSGMKTTRYAMHIADQQGIAAWKLATQGGNQ